MPDIDRIVDELLNETAKEGDAPASVSLPQGTVLFTVPGDLTTFSRAMERVRHYPAKQRAVVFCESIEQMLPEDLLPELAPQCRLVRTTGCVPESLLRDVEKVVIPALSEPVAERILSKDAEGTLPAIWRAAVDAGVPTCAPVRELDHPRERDLSDAVASARAQELARSLLAQGIVDLSPQPVSPDIPPSNTPPELELVGELVQYLSNGCETEEGQPCTECGMCKVRGF